MNRRKISALKLVSTVVLSRQKTVKNNETPDLISQATTSNLMSRNTVGVAFILLSGVGVIFSALQWVGFATVLLSLLMFEILARAD